MDIALDLYGDLYITPQGDILLKDSVAQKIRIKLLWFEKEWRWDLDEGIPYRNDLLIKNADIDYFESVIRAKIFEIDEVTEVKDVSIVFDSKTRNAVIKYTAVTDNEVIKEEVSIRCQITE